MNYKELKQKVDELTREVDRATGALEQSMKKLKEDFDCDALEEAEKLLKELQAEEVKAKEEFDSALQEFANKWKLSESSDD